MTLGFLVFADLLLILRLRPLLTEMSGESGAPWRLAGAELLALFLLYAPSGALYLAALTIVALNVVPWLLARSGRYGNGSRLAMAAVLIGALSVVFAPRFGIHFRTSIGPGAVRLFSWTAFGPRLRALAAPRPMALLFGLLLAASEANLLIRWCIAFFRIRPDGISSGSSEDNRGRVIGFLERALIFFFVVNSQFGAIGFVLAAKAFTRFKDLEKRDFAEYVLIGTLLSSSVAMAIGVLFRGAA